MAAIGRVGSFATTEAPQDYISGALQNVENQSFRYRAERRLAEEEKAKAKEEKEKGIVADLGKVNINEVTPYESHNAFAIDGANKLYQYTADLARQYSEGKISKVEYEIGKNNAMNQITLMNDANKRINEQVKGYSKLVGEGKIAPGFEQSALRLGGAYDNVRMKWELTPQGRLEAVAYDEDGTIIERGGLDKFGNNSFTPVLAYDFDKDKDEFIKAYPKVLTEQFVGNTKVGKKGISPQIIEAIDLKVDAIIKNPNALAIKAAEVTGQQNPNVTDENVINKVRENLKKEYEALYSTEKMVDEATGRAYLGLAYSKYGDEKAKEQVIISEPSQLKEGGMKDGVKLQTKTKDFPLGNAIIKGTGGREQKATNVYVSPGGKMYLRVEESGNESKTIKEFDLTESGKKKYEDEKKKLGKAFNFNTFTQSGVLEPGDYKSGSTSIKAPQPKMLDFGKDANEVGRYAIKMGYNSAKEMQDDFIERAGGNNFIKTPDQRKSESEPKTTIKIGDVIEGYKFLGGDPNNAKSWKKI